MKHIEMFTDGVCFGNPGAGGWGIILRYGDHEKELSGGEPDTTNNRMNMIAIIEGLKQLKEPCSVTVTTKAKYIADTITKNENLKSWIKSKVTHMPNIDLWEELAQLLESHQVECIWMKDSPEKQRCHDLAVAQREKARIQRIKGNSSMRYIEMFTDGACSGNPGPGGWGTILRYGDYQKEFSGGEPQTTNNRMEMTAVIEGLKKLKEPCSVTITTDSKYVVDSITKNWVYSWKKKNWKKSDGKLALNIDLWEEMLKLLEIHQVEFVWVKGHAGHPENERCDALAVAQRDTFS